jgi:hypothetical protein
MQDADKSPERLHPIAKLLARAVHGNYHQYAAYSVEDFLLVLADPRITEQNLLELEHYVATQVIRGLRSSESFLFVQQIANSLIEKEPSYVSPLYDIQTTLLGAQEACKRLPASMHFILPSVIQAISEVTLLLEEEKRKVAERRIGQKPPYYPGECHENGDRWIA